METIRILHTTGQLPNFNFLLATGGVAAGFPSPAADFTDEKLNLSELLIKHPNTTFFARAVGNSMSTIGIEDSDLLIVDRSLKPASGKIAVCYIEGGFTVKIIQYRGEDLFLVPANKTYKEIRVTEEMGLIVWGIVTACIKNFL